MVLKWMRDDCAVCRLHAIGVAERVTKLCCAIRPTNALASHETTMAGAQRHQRVRLGDHPSIPKRCWCCPLFHRCAMSTSDWMHRSWTMSDSRPLLQSATVGR